MVAPPGVPTTAFSLPSFVTMVGVMEETCACPAQWRFCCRPTGRTDWRAGRGEIVHLIIEEKPALHHHFRAIHAVERSGDGTTLPAASTVKCVVSALSIAAT